MRASSRPKWLKIKRKGRGENEGPNTDVMKNLFVSKIKCDGSL